MKPIANILRPGAFGDVVMTSAVTSSLAHEGYDVHYYTNATELAALLEGVAAVRHTDRWDSRAPGRDYVARFSAHSGPVLNEICREAGVTLSPMSLRNFPRLFEGRYITLQRETGWSSLKEYPHWDAVLNGLKQDFPNLPVVEIGPERPWSDTCALIQHAALHLGGDSVGAHIAGAYRTPAVVVFGSSNPDTVGHPTAINLTAEPRQVCHPCYIEDRFTNGFRFGETCSIGGCAKLVPPQCVIEAATRSLVKQTICLNMIVRDEAHTILRALESARPIIDSWVIVDTGSTDGTQEVIREALKDIPGTLHERPWIGFGPNRTEAITLARNAADYILLLDADDWLEIPNNFAMPALAADAIKFTICHGPIRFQRICLVKSGLPWRFVGVLHEYIEADCQCSHDRLPICLHFGGNGARSKVPQVEKYTRDAAVLEAGLLDEPENARYVFYLAQSYKDSFQHDKAIATYQRRAEMGGYVEEVFCSLLEIARLKRHLKLPATEISAAFLRAYESRPSRAEPLGELAAFYREEGKSWPLAFLYASRAVELPTPEDQLFVGFEWYDWRALDEYSIAAYWTGHYEKSRVACARLLASDKLPAEQRNRVLANMNFSLSKV